MDAVYRGPYSLYRWVQLGPGTLRAIPFEILRGGGMGKNIWGSGSRKNQNMWVGVGEKNKTMGGGPRNFPFCPPISNGIALTYISDGEIHLCVTQTI